MKEKMIVIDVRVSESNRPPTVSEIINNSIILRLDSVTALVNGATKIVDQQEFSAPFVNNAGNTFIPLRFISENLGGVVSWNNTEKKATIEISGRIVEMWIDNKTMRINENGITRSESMSSAPIIYNNLTYIPLRAFAVAVGKNVAWENDTRSIVISDYVLEDSSSLLKQVSNDTSRYMIRVVGLQKNYELVIDGGSEKVDFSTATISSGSLIQLISATSDDTNQDWADRFSTSTEPLNAYSFSLSQLPNFDSRCLTEDGKTYKFSVFLKTEQFPNATQVGKFSVTVRVRPPEINGINDIGLVAGVDSPKALDGTIRSWRPIKKVTVYIGNTVMNQCENSYSYDSKNTF